VVRDRCMILRSVAFRWLASSLLGTLIGEGLCVVLGWFCALLKPLLCPSPYLEISVLGDASVTSVRNKR
jgi:hypothetical protein